MNLKRFIVQGWAKDPDTNERIPLRKSTIRALSGKAAAKTYARCQGIKESWWKKGTSPRIVIRVEDAPPVAPVKQSRNRQSQSNRRAA